MSEISLARTAGNRLPQSNRGDRSSMHELVVRVTLPVLAWLRPIATAAARACRPARQAGSKISDRSSELDINVGPARPLLKVRGRLARLALSVRPCESTMESGRFVLRCSAAASLAYGLATLIGFQHPVWAPIEALVVSQASRYPDWSRCSAARWHIWPYGRIAAHAADCPQCDGLRAGDIRTTHNQGLPLDLSAHSRHGTLTRHYRAGRLDQGLAGAAWCHGWGNSARPRPKGLERLDQSLCLGRHRFSRAVIQRTSAGKVGISRRRSRLE